jgi:hypothetical protein
LLVLGVAADAFANPASVVPAAQPAEDPTATYSDKSVDVYGEVDYSYELDSSTIVRERLGPAADPNQPLPTVSDLSYKKFEHRITPSLHVGIFQDAFFSVALPIVITQVRELSLVDPTDRSGSSTIQDGIISADGFDARDPGTPTTGSLIFRGPKRKGLDQVYLTLGVAPMNQATDATKPTWKLGAEFRLSVGQIAKFDPMAPNQNTGVSEGVHELKLWTTFARSLGWAEPWVELWWMTPLTAKDDSLFQDPGFGATNTRKSQEAGLGFGLELYAIRDVANQTTISLDFGTLSTLHFEGREYTEMWEVFASAGDSRGAGPLILDADPTKPDVQPMSHPGITNVENYLDMTARFAIRAQLGPHVRFAVIGDVMWETDHALAFADAGVDRDDEGDLVNPGTDEVNPLHKPLIDLVGHRYRAQDSFNIALGVQGTVLF